MAKSTGREAKSSSRRCWTRVSVTTPTEVRTPLPTKFAVAEKHMGRFLSCESYTRGIIDLFSNMLGKARPRSPVLNPCTISENPHFRAHWFPLQLSFLYLESLCD